MIVYTTVAIRNLRFLEYIESEKEIIATNKKKFHLAVSVI